MQHKALAILVCFVLGFVAVHGSQIRLMNARFFPGLSVSVTTDLFSTNNMSMTVQSLYPSLIGVNNIPVSGYVQLPNDLFYLYQNLSIFAYDADYFGIPIPPLTQTTYTLVENQRYSLVYVGRSEDLGEPTADVPENLFVVEEVGPFPGPLLKIVNVAVASFPEGGLYIISDQLGEFSIPYGRDSGFYMVNSGTVNITAIVPGSLARTFFVELTNQSTVIYIRGDLGSFTELSYEIAESDWFDFNTGPPVQPPVPAPVSTPISSPSPTPSFFKVRLLNSADPYGSGYSMEIFGAANSPNFTTYLMSEYQYVYGPSGQYQVAVYGPGQVLHSYNSMYFQTGKTYTVVSETPYAVLLEDDLPSWIANRTSSYVRVANFGPDGADVELSLDYWGTAHWYMMRGDVYSYVESFGGYGSVLVSYSTNASVSTYFYMPQATVTTVFILRMGNTYFHLDTQTIPGSAQVCVNGYVESNGVCNCYAGYRNDPYSSYKCTAAAPYYCFLSQNDTLSNEYVPWIPYWNAQVYGNRLYFSVESQIVTGRRTVIEMPNPQCNFINSPQYYQQNTNGCLDQMNVNVPFTECGFTKLSSSSEDVYRGTVLVKQIDRVVVAGTTYDRVIETPMPISIRLPKTLAIQSYVQVYGPPSLAIEAAFVGQTVSTESQSGSLQYVSAVQYPLAINNVELVDLPYGVFAWIEVININCSSFGPCVQRLEIHVNTTSCSISGVYRMVVSLGCRSEQGCPEEATNGTQVYLESRIVAQSLCGEMNIDIELYGYLQAYTDVNFSNPALAFYPGESAYFLISAFSPRVSLSKVSLVSLYYYGPNVNFEYLYYNSTTTTVADANDFTSDSLGGSQAYFGLDITVSTPGSGDNSTLFKLYQGQNGVYNFVAVVDVEWYVNSSTPAGSPQSSAPFAAKKRMILQGSQSNQGSQFTAQVQIAGPTPSSPQPVASTPTNSDPVSSGAFLSGSVFGMIAVAVFAMF